MAASPDTARIAAPPAQPVRMFGRYQLLKLLGKSTRSMAWWVAEPRSGQDLILVIPRQQPRDAQALERWMAVARKAARLDHPGLAQAVEVGEHDRWPFVAYDRDGGTTLAERLSAKGIPGSELAPWAVQLLQGLAFAHEAGMAHHDLQTFLLLSTENGAGRIMGLEVASLATDAAGGDTQALPSLQAQRRAAERDVLALGLVMHHALAGSAALEQVDTASVIERMPPLGRDIVRLPWSTTHAVAEPLRAIVNRATDRQERQRYRNARTLSRALEGWITVESGSGGGPIALLLDRMRAAGALPGSPGGAARVARLALLERERTIELAEIVLEDVGLSFELLRMVNSAGVRGSSLSGSGPVLTLRRAIAMMGLDGVRRGALSLRDWPGPLNEAGATELERLIERVKRAAKVATWLRPAGYDPEVIYLLAMLQNLGRLLTYYHFPDEAQQIRRLMQPAPPAKPGDAEEPGMSEEGASFAVLGTDIEALGAAVGRHWGLEDSVLHMMRRLPPAAAVRNPDGDHDLLRMTASAANEVIDATTLPTARQGAALQKVVQRYGRTLNVTLRDVISAAQGKEPGSEQPLDAPATNIGVLS
ncbi:MAG: serine/threonine protein kinase [Aquabacterium sp.]